MEILFKSPVQPQSLLNLDEAIALAPGETVSVLLCAIREATLNSYLENTHQLWLLTYLQALQLQESLFRPAFRKLTPKWIPTPKEKQIIETALLGYFPDNHIQGFFATHGKLYGITALVLAFNETESIHSKWLSIKDKVAQEWLVQNVSRLLKRRNNYWIRDFKPTSMSFILEIRFFR
jgi:hypothetical protein